MKPLNCIKDAKIIFIIAGTLLTTTICLGKATERKNMAVAYDIIY
jgi:hypothetical protein